MDNCDDLSENQHWSIEKEGFIVSASGEYCLELNSTLSVSRCNIDVNRVKLNKFGRLSSSTVYYYDDGGENDVTCVRLENLNGAEISFTIQSATLATVGIDDDCTRIGATGFKSFF